MAVIKFDHMVKVGEAYYPANRPITVQDAERYLAQGACLVSGDLPETAGQTPNKRAPRKKKEA